MTGLVLLYLYNTHALKNRALGLVLSQNGLQVVTKGYHINEKNYTSPSEVNDTSNPASSNQRHTFRICKNATQSHHYLYAK